MDIRRSIIKVFSANLLQLMTSIVIGFFVPAALSVEGYAALRTYTLFIGYVGFLHLGFIDGMYIKYGGKNYSDINKSQLKLEHRIMLISQMIISLIAVVIALTMGNILYLFIGLSILPINLYSFHRMFYQATGQFRLYTRYSYVYTLCYLAINVFSAIILKSQIPWYYCAASLGANVLVFAALEGRFFKDTKNIEADTDRKVIFKITNQNVRVGFVVMLGNLAVTVFYALDQWFVKGFLTEKDFAYYAFAVSMLSLINVLVNAIAITFYNFLAQEKSKEKIGDIKTILLILGVFSSLGHFVLAGIVHMWLEKYIPSLSVISISFAALPYMIVVNALYVNLYKVDRNEKKYLKVVVQMLIVGAALNLLAVFTHTGIQGIAMATTASFIIWFIYSMRHFSYLKIKKEEVVLLIGCLVGFLLCSQLMQWFIGGILYFGIAIGLSLLLFRKLLWIQLKALFAHKKGEL